MTPLRWLPMSLTLLALGAFGTAVLVLGPLRPQVPVLDRSLDPWLGSGAGGPSAICTSSPQQTASDAAAPSAQTVKLGSAPGEADGNPAAAKSAAGNSDPLKGATSVTANAPGLPVFDIVRVEPTGEAVIGGRSVPGARIELLRNGAVVELTIADATGAFALTTPALAAGNYELALRATPPGGSPVMSTQAVAVTIKTQGAPYVAVLRPGEPSSVLSNPLAQAVTAKAGVINSDSGPQISIELAEAEDRGRVFVLGKAVPGADVRLYLNDTYLADAVAKPSGQVAFAIEGGVKPGHYTVRLDEVEPGSGQVKNRAEVPFTMPDGVAAAPEGARQAQVAAPLGEQTALAANPAAGVATITPARIDTGSARATLDPVAVPSVHTHVVLRGDTLWRISRETYRIGERYTTIYKANQDQIADPDRIYPGQVFVLPSRTR